jgi:hypothetical protein
MGRLAHAERAGSVVIHLRRTHSPVSVRCMAVPPAVQATVRVPEPVAYIRDLLSGLGVNWFLCGGWAVDAWLGQQTRDHADVDVSVFHCDQRAIFDHLAGWALVGHDPNVPDDTNEPWNGRHLDLPAHIHVPARGSSLATSPTATHTEFEAEFMLDQRSGQDWILRNDPRISLPMNRCAPLSAWRLPTATPEAVLFYKAGGHLSGDEIAARRDALRPHDERDFLALVPRLTVSQRRWLQATLTSIHPGHPWLTHLAG